MAFYSSINKDDFVARLSVRKFVTTALALVLGVLALPSFAKDDYRIAWSIYVGWMPWSYAAETGIVDKWADKYGITIEVVQFNDYIESINQYTVGAFDGCTMTNMDALTIPAAGGVDSTALIVGDFSNGNDGIVLKGADKTVADLRGQNVNLVELSVSHYLLARALTGAGMTERDLTVVNTSDADIVAAFATDDVSSVVTWNPLLAEVQTMPEVSPVFDSSMIPGEIIDMLVVSTEALEDPRFAKALVGAWYETMAVMAAANETAIDAKTHMATASGTDLSAMTLNSRQRKCSLNLLLLSSSWNQVRSLKQWQMSPHSLSNTVFLATARRDLTSLESSFLTVTYSVQNQM